MPFSHLTKAVEALFFLTHALTR